MLASGCGAKSRPRDPVFPVSGKLLVDGHPPAKARIFFHPETYSATRRESSFALVGPDGVFHAQTYAVDDGLAAGAYDVTVVWPTFRVVDGEEVAGADQLGGRFIDRANPVARVIVTDGPVEMPPIDLQLRSTY